MTIKYKEAMTFAAMVILFLGSCKKDDPVIPNEEEIITSLIYTLTPENGGENVELIFQDLDGDGGQPPSITGGTLDANQNYTGTLQLWNETTTPPLDISAEIRDEAVEHQFFFNISNSLNLDISYDDQDANGAPIGLTTLAMAGDVSQGQLTIILRHEPDKTASGVADGNINNAGGETDIEVTFDLSIQ